LFMVPGMNHCQGGPGTDVFDKMAAIESWVATGSAPKQIVASHMTNGASDKTRPLCPVPLVAEYKGTGATNDAATFACARALGDRSRLMAGGVDAAGGCCARARRKDWIGTAR